MNVEIRGVTPAIPPSSEMFRVPALCPREPATLEETAGKNRAPAGRGLDVGIGKPGVKGPCRKLRTEAREEGDEQDVLERPGGDQRPAPREFDEFDHVERLAVEEEREDPD